MIGIPFGTVTAVLKPALTHTGRLLYRGPSLSDLHATAKAGSLDEHAPIHAVAEVRIDAPREIVWRVLSDLASWPSLDIGVTAMTAPRAIAVDETFEWTNGGVPIRSRLAVVEDGRELSWTGVTYGVKAIHRRLLADDGADGTLLRSEETMAAPLLNGSPTQRASIADACAAPRVAHWRHRGTTGATHHSSCVPRLSPRAGGPRTVPRTRRSR